MGLCKCPKKKVTNQFCFEHKVNVCEHCMTSNHQKCIVGPYLQWLEDSSYQSICTLCQQNLLPQECVRLLCFHIFHLNCMNQYANELPSNTAPAGYTCPTCHKSLFPSNTASSPVALKLQSTLSDVSWARIGLGMPLIDSNQPNEDTLHSNAMNTHSVPQVVHHNPISNSSSVPIPLNNIANYITSNNDSNFGNTSARNKSYDSDHDSRKSLLDIDDDKYRNKSPMEFISRWLRSHSTFVKRRQMPAFTYRRLIIIGILVFLGLCTLVHYFLKFGRESAEHDPMLDPRFNPNIRNEEIER